jgi:hypothetical protein
LFTDIYDYYRLTTERLDTGFEQSNLWPTTISDFVDHSSRGSRGQILFLRKNGMRRWIPTLAFAALSVSAGLAAAAPTNLTVGLNEGLTLPLRGEASVVSIANPAVADVMVPNGHTVMVLGKGYGSTRLTVTDRAGHRLVDTAVTVVSPDDGRVTVYRGGAGADYACVGGRCHHLDGPPSGGDVIADADPAAEATREAASAAEAAREDTAAVGLGARAVKTGPASGGEAAAAARAGAPQGAMSRDPS